MDMDGPLDFESEDPLLSSPASDKKKKKNRFSLNFRLLFGSVEKNRMNRADFTTDMKLFYKICFSSPQSLDRTLSVSSFIFLLYVYEKPVFVIRVYLHIAAIIGLGNSVLRVLRPHVEPE